MKILVLNSGSSSLKFQVIETTPEQIATNRDHLLAKGVVEKIGSSESMISCQSGPTGSIKFSKPIPDHKSAIETAFQWLRDGKIITAVEEIEGVGHRMVHGGEHFAHSARITDEILRTIESCIDLAPLHNPANLKGYYATRMVLPQATHVAVFDTAFHHTLPAKAYLYGIPYVHYTRDRIRRYGFHGTSHRYVSYRYAQIHSKIREDFKLITVHLGNGCSICAIDQGRSVDTSMGFTPLEGLLMGTRPGDMDTGALLHLMGKHEMGFHEAEVLLNKHSGLYGISGVSNDMRDLLHESDNGNERARYAVEMFCYRVKKYIGSYLAVLNGCDAIVFTGGIGENSPRIRAMICSGMTALGVTLDSQRNGWATGEEGSISQEGGTPEVWVIPTNEELLIARDTMRCIMGLPLP